MNTDQVYNLDCISGAQEHLADRSVDLIICDPPFGIKESGFDKHYNRSKSKVIQGYVEAPEDYAGWSREWIAEAKRVLKDNGSFYIISGHSHLREILNAVYEESLVLINHVIWKFNFGVNTSKKYVTAHYHILYLKKTEKSSPKFNLHCRFGASEKDPNGGSLLYADLEDVWKINKEYSQEEKNANKLPEALIEKIIMYSSDPGDVVCDFFLGNFTTATVACRLGRKICGFEKNPNSFTHHVGNLSKIEFGCDLSKITVKDTGPANQGQPWSDEAIEKACVQFRHLTTKKKMTKKDAIAQICKESGRGRFSVLNVIDENLHKYGARQKTNRDEEADLSEV